MNTIIIYGSGEDKSISKLLRKYFELHSSCAYIGNGAVSLHREAEFLLIDSENLTRIEADRGIVIFKNNISDYSFPDIPSDFTAVLSSENTAAMNFLRDNKIITVTCGIGVADTLSISSIDDDCATVSLQRQLRTIFGEINEPQEIIIRNIPPGPKYPVMCLCASLLLTQKSEGMEIVL